MGKLGGNLRGVIADLRCRLGEPPVDGAVHEQKAKQEHEERWDKRQEESPDVHAGAQARAEHLASLIGEQFDEIAHQQDEKRDEEQKDQDGERGKKKNIRSGMRIDGAQVECVETDEEQEKNEYGDCQQRYPTMFRVSQMGILR